MDHLLRDIGIEIKEILSESPYMILYAEWQSQPIIIRCIHEKSINTDEFEILKYIQENVIHPWWFPKTYFKHCFEPIPFWFIKDGTESCHYVRSILVYEYISGESILNMVLSPEEKKKMRKDLFCQLADLHNIGLSYNNVDIKNIIKTDKGYRFIGFDRVQDRLGLFKDLRGLIPYSGKESDLKKLQSLLIRL